jgi:hypothetical protein
LGEFSTIRLLFVGSLGFFEMKKWPKNGDTFGYKFITFSAISYLKTWFVFWHYLAWQLFWLLFKKYWAIFSKLSGHPASDEHSRSFYFFISDDKKSFITSIPGRFAELLRSVQPRRLHRRHPCWRRRRPCRSTSLIPPTTCARAMVPLSVRQLVKTILHPANV